MSESNAASRRPVAVLSRAPALLEILEDRHARASTLMVSPLPVSSWHEVIGERQARVLYVRSKQPPRTSLYSLSHGRTTPRWLLISGMRGVFTGICRHEDFSRSVYPIYDAHRRHNTLHVSLSDRLCVKTSPRTTFTGVASEKSG